MVIAFGNAASAESLNGTVNSSIGAKGAHAGVNGSLHSNANARLNAGKRSPNGLTPEDQIGLASGSRIEGYTKAECLLPSSSLGSF